MRKAFYALFTLLLIASVLIAPAGARADGGRPEAGWSGTWYVNWTKEGFGEVHHQFIFDMVFSQSGSQVTGSGNLSIPSPCINDPNSSAIHSYAWSLTGTVNGNQLTGRWQCNLPESCSHQGGPFAFTLDASGRTFQGNCKGDYEYTWDSPVTGTRSDSGTVIPPYTPPYVPPYIPPTPTPP